MRTVRFLLVAAGLVLLIFAIVVLPIFAWVPGIASLRTARLAFLAIAAAFGAGELRLRHALRIPRSPPA